MLVISLKTPGAEQSSQTPAHFCSVSAFPQSQIDLWLIVRARNDLKHSEGELCLNPLHFLLLQQTMQHAARVSPLVELLMFLPHSCTVSSSFLFLQERVQETSPSHIYGPLRLRRRNKPNQSLLRPKVCSWCSHSVFSSDVSRSEKTPRVQFEGRSSESAASGTDEASEDLTCGQRSFSGEEGDY